jgi:hypothetical protein
MRALFLNRAIGLIDELFGDYTIAIVTHAAGRAGRWMRLAPATPHLRIRWWRPNPRLDTLQREIEEQATLTIARRRGRPGTDIEADATGAIK